jgi:anti-anti-sigma factor
MSGDHSKGLILKLEGADDVVRVRIRGDLDFASASRLERLIDRLGDLRSHRVVLDLEQAAHVDSTGLTALVAIKMRGDRERFQVFVERMPANVERMFAVTGLDRLLVAAPEWLVG